MLRNKDDEAIALLTRVVSKIDTIAVQNDEQTQVQNLAKSITDETLPSVQFRMQTARFLTELQKFKLAIKVLKTVI